MRNNIVSQFTNDNRVNQFTHNNSVRKFRTCLVFLLFSVFLINISSFKVLAASTLTVTPTVDKNKVTFKINDSANLSDAISILVMQKGTNSVIYMDQGKLSNGEYTFSTVLPKGDYIGYVSSSSTDNVPIQEVTVTNDEKVVGFRTIAPIQAKIGSEVVLPSTVIAIFDDGANRIIAVNWISAPDTTKAGNQTILGTIDGSDVKPNIDIIIGDQTSSSDSTLSGITVGGVAVANFATDKTSYDIELPVGTKTVPEVIGTVTATGKANAVVTTATSLPGATNILVTAEDGVTTKTYTINFTVAQSSGSGGGETPSDDNGSGGSGNNGSGNNGNINSVPVQVVVDNSGSTPKVVISFESSSIAKDKINEVKPIISDTTKALELKVNVDNIKGGIGSLSLSANRLTMSIPFSVVDLTNVQAGNYLKLEQSSNSTDESLKGVKGLGEVLSFNLGVYNNEGTKLSEVHQFAKGSVKINIQLTEAQIININLSKIAALYFNESSNKWEVVGGSFDAATKTFSFETLHFSKFTIADMSAAPVFDAIGVQNAEQGNFLQFKVNATSTNNTSLTYTASNLPTGASFDAATQNLNWTPNVNQSGNYTISFNVTDGINTVKKDVTVVVRDVPGAELLQKALVEKDFYHFNIAYYKIMKLSDEKEKAEALDKLASIHDLVWNADIAKVNKMLDSLVATGSGRTYNEVEAVIGTTNLSAVDKGYLLGELTSWGKKLVFTDEYKAAVDALGIAWNKLDADSVSKAEVAIKKVTNTYSKEYLLGELAKVKAKIK